MLLPDPNKQQNSKKPLSKHSAVNDSRSRTTRVAINRTVNSHRLDEQLNWTNTRVVRHSARAILYRKSCRHTNVARTSIVDPRCVSCYDLTRYRKWSHVSTRDAYGFPYFWDEFMRARAQNGNYASRKVVSLGHNFVDSQEDAVAICR